MIERWHFRSSISSRRFCRVSGEGIKTTESQLAPVCFPLWWWQLPAHAVALSVNCWCTQSENTGPFNASHRFTMKSFCDSYNMKRDDRWVLSLRGWAYLVRRALGSPEKRAWIHAWNNRLNQAVPVHCLIKSVVHFIINTEGFGAQPSLSGENKRVVLLLILCNDSELTYQAESHAQWWGVAFLKAQSSLFAIVGSLLCCPFLRACENSHRWAAFWLFNSLAE
jgi:hypothetical protein